jgi:ubiquinone/menaquinone biosynthesis C-methylase UbiE
MNPEKDYLSTNKQSWNEKTEIHLKSEFYDVPGFLAGKNMLNSIELNLLGDIKGKKILHFQCHFGLDTLSLGRMGADVTGVDLSDKAIKSARELSEKSEIPATFICCDLYELPKHLDEKFDIVFTSYGTIGWLPDLDKWAQIVQHFLKPGGKFVFVEFHPVVWMFDDDFKTIAYNYFNNGPIVETLSGTYAEKDAPITQQYVMWNHSISEVVTNLIKNGLEINSLDEINYSPYNCFKNTIEFEPHKFRIAHFEDKIPMVYAIVATRHLPH